MPTVWIHSGPWAGQLRDMSGEDAAQAEKEGWGQDINGLSLGQDKPVSAGTHEAADAYYAKMTGAAKKAAPEEKPWETLQPPHSQRSLEAEEESEAEQPGTEPASDSSTYPTRELRASEPAKKHPPVTRGKRRGY